MMNDELSIMNYSKVVIFSQWERMTRLVAQELERSGVEYVYLHGNVPSRERQERIEAFQQDAKIRVFLSTDAGATGLNLQVANVVINLDMPWNPALLEQRIGRIHRIGQTRGVEVINLISAGTIEEDMLSKLRFKATLFEGVLDGGEDAVFLSDDKFEGLLGGLHDYMEENDTPAESIVLHDEEPPREAVQGELLFEEEEVEEEEVEEKAVEDAAVQAAAEAPVAQSPLLQRIAADFAELLLADEETRQRAAEWFRALR